MNNTRSTVSRPLAIFAGLVLLLMTSAHAAFARDAEVPAGFDSGYADVNGVHLHYVIGGRGPAVILLHGFPEDWSAFASVMPQLATHFRILAIDLRGIGGSTPTPQGYDMGTLGEDAAQLARRLALDHPYIVGHDFGGTAAYAAVRLHPTEFRGLMIVDVPVMGVEPWDTIKTDPRLWHFGFHQAPGLAEQLLEGREAIYIGYFIRRSSPRPEAIDKVTIDRYARAYAGMAHLTAAMQMYRDMDASERFGKEHREPVAVPLVVAAGDRSFARQLPAMLQGFKNAGFGSVATEVISGSGHYVMDDNPQALATLIERYAGIDERPGSGAAAGRHERSAPTGR